jgi:hypothetical protein
MIYEKEGIKGAQSPLKAPIFHVRQWDWAQNIE